MFHAEIMLQDRHVKDVVLAKGIIGIRLASMSSCYGTSWISAVLDRFLGSLMNERAFGLMYVLCSGRQPHRSTSEYVASHDKHASFFVHRSGMRTVVRVSIWDQALSTTLT